MDQDLLRHRLQQTPGIANNKLNSFTLTNWHTSLSSEPLKKITLLLLVCYMKSLPLQNIFVYLEFSNVFYMVAFNYLKVTTSIFDGLLYNAIKINKNLSIVFVFFKEYTRQSTCIMSLFILS